jgi:GTP-binding protein EngB required for normal cell division
VARYTNAQKAKMEEEEFNREVDSMELEDLPTANIMVAGITGTGKSTLINAVFGSSIAATGKGKPVTSEMRQYEDKNIPIRIWDTVGLELDSEKTKESIKNIKEKIADQTSSEDKFDRIHAIWYCINSGSNRYQGEELNFIKSLHEVGVPFIIVLTQCIGDEDGINEFENEIRDVNTSMGMDDIDIVQVCAQAFKLRGVPPIEAFGLVDLVNVTLDRLPEFIKGGFVAAQRVSKVKKREECEKIIYYYVELSNEGIFDKIPLANIISANTRIKQMLGKIGKTYNTVLDEKKIDEIAEKSNINFENVWPALLKPSVNEYSDKVNQLLSIKKEDGFEVKIDTFSKGQRVARMIAFYGYTFIDSMEELWEEITEEDLKNVDTLTHKLCVIINERLKKGRMGKVNTK